MLASYHFSIIRLLKVYLDLEGDKMEKRYSYCKFTIGQEKEIIKLYQDGYSMVKLGKMYVCDPSTIKNILKAYNIPSRTLSEARRNTLGYSINEEAFKNIDDADSAYWLGVMYSDGFITKSGPYTNYFGLTVSEKDSEWLESFKAFLKYNGEVKHYISNTAFKENTPIAKLVIGNNKIVQNLENWGVIEHKTFKISCLPNIKFLDDFIRGYIDGDGSLLKRLPHITISGTGDFLESIANYFNLPYKIYSDKTIYSLQYNALQSRYLEKRLYKNAKYYLKRKYDIASRSFNSPITLEEAMKNSEYQGKSLEL